MKRIAFILTVLLTSIFVLTSCYNPSLNDEPFVCGGTPGNPECPDGYQCYGGLCRTSPPECWADNFFGNTSGKNDADLEPNNIPSQAYILPCGDINAGQPGSNCPDRYHEQPPYVKLSICGYNDIDFYKIYLYQGEMIDFTLKYNYMAFRDLSLSVFKTDTNGNINSKNPVAKSESTSSDEKVSFVVETTGWYYFMIYGATSQDTNAYAIEWKVSDAPQGVK